MQKVVLTIDSTKNAYLLLRLIEQFDFIRSIEMEKPALFESEDNEIFTGDLADNFYLDDLSMTVKDFRLQTLRDEKEKGMTKSEFFKSMKMRIA